MYSLCLILVFRLHRPLSIFALPSCIVLPLMLATGSFGPPSIPTDPTNITVFLNHDGSFSCVTRDGSWRNWLVNGTEIELNADFITDSSVLEGDDLQLYLLVLNIVGRVEYNGSRVQCVTGGEDVDPVYSENATLIIQGPLQSLDNLTTSSNASSITLSWTAPYSLDVTDVDPDIWYSVHIYNVTDKPTAISCTDCINIAGTHYTFTPDRPSSCHKYNFTVYPLNGAGLGHSSPNITGHTGSIQNLCHNSQWSVVLESGYIYLIPECTSTTDVHIILILDAHTVLAEISLQNVQTCSVVKFSDEKMLSKILVYPMNHSELLSNKPSYIYMWETERKDERNAYGDLHLDDSDISAACRDECTLICLDSNDTISISHGVTPRIQLDPERYICAVINRGENEGIIQHVTVPDKTDDGDSKDEDKLTVILATVILATVGAACIGIVVVLCIVALICYTVKKSKRVSTKISRTNRNDKKQDTKAVYIAHPSVQSTMSLIDGNVLTCESEATATVATASSISPHGEDEYSPSEAQKGELKLSIKEKTGIMKSPKTSNSKPITVDNDRKGRSEYVKQSESDTVTSARRSQPKTLCDRSPGMMSVDNVSENDVCTPFQEVV